MTTRYWTCYWMYKYWHRDINSEQKPISASASNQFTSRGVREGDIAYILSSYQGTLFLGGRMTVHQIKSHDEIIIERDDSDVFDADEWICDDLGGSILNLHRQLAPEVSRRLLFETVDGPKPLFFKSKNEIDHQSVRGIRELTPETAALLDRIISITDSIPITDEILIVTQEMIDSGEAKEREQYLDLPGEELAPREFLEGDHIRVLTNRYERNRQARTACIEHFGSQCYICGFDFGKFYGPDAAGFIHVHHKELISQRAKKRKVDFTKDLVPLCPNCHAYVHLGGELRDVDDVKANLANRQPND